MMTVTVSTRLLTLISLYKWKRELGRESTKKVDGVRWWPLLFPSTVALQSLLTTRTMTQVRLQDNTIYGSNYILVNTDVDLFPTYDIKYVLGGRERGVAAKYIAATDLMERVALAKRSTQGRCR
jgi:hypothetical protein